MLQHSLLGKTTQYPNHYAPELLFPIARAVKWQELGLTANTLPYQGVDIWNGYELSWLNNKGKPLVAIGQFVFPANSPNIIESKSFKLYLNSINHSVFATKQQLIEVLQKDLSLAAAAPVRVSLSGLDEVTDAGISKLTGRCIDDLDIDIEEYAQPNIQLLRCDPHKQVDETLYSHLLRSNCPVTGQPDWGSLAIDYAGNALDPASLLRYLISFRQHNDFHEQCVERIWLDLFNVLRPTKLCVYARYVRRGGLDINPYRSLGAATSKNQRLARQ